MPMEEFVFLNDADNYYVSALGRKWKTSDNTYSITIGRPPSGKKRSDYKSNTDWLCAQEPILYLHAYKDPYSSYQRRKEQGKAEAFDGMLQLSISKASDNVDVRNIKLKVHDNVCFTVQAEVADGKGNAKRKFCFRRLPL